MKDVWFVTSNPGKAESLQNILSDLDSDLNVHMLSADYPEDKDKGTVQAVALAGAKYCADQHDKSVLVTDTGIFIESLNEFPGINTAFTLDRIGCEGVIKLMEGHSDRGVEWVLSLGYCEPGGDPIEFTAEVTGTISESVLGSDGFGFDPIFVPEGHTETLAQKPGLRDEISPFRVAVEQFAASMK